jgi:hypothetical protein
MTAQDDVNTADAAIAAFLTALSGIVAQLNATLAAGSGQAPVDTTQLNQLVAQLPAAQAALEALVVVPAPVTTPVTAPTAPVAPAVFR